MNQHHSFHGFGMNPLTEEVSGLQVEYHDAAKTLQNLAGGAEVAETFAARLDVSARELDPPPATCYLACRFVIRMPRRHLPRLRGDMWPVHVLEP